MVAALQAPIIIDVAKIARRIKDRLRANLELPGQPQERAALERHHSAADELTKKR